AAGERFAPFIIRHFVPVWSQPGNVFDRGTSNRAALKKTAPVETRMSSADCDQALHILDQVAIILLEPPVNPAQLVVLAIRVVVATLCSAELIACQEHRNTLREEQAGQQITRLAGAQLNYRWIADRTLGAAIPAPIVGLAVAVIF